MRWIISLAGGVAAAVTGAAAGGHFKPDAGSMVGQIHAPRLETAAAGHRTPAPVAPEIELAAETGETPDYIVGTDWLPPPPPPEEEVAPAVRPRPTRTPPGDVQVAAAPAAADWAQDAREGPDYPSVSGGGVVPDSVPYY